MIRITLGGLEHEIINRASAAIIYDVNFIRFLDGLKSNLFSFREIFINLNNFPVIKKDLIPYLKVKVKKFSDNMSVNQAEHNADYWVF